MNATYDHLVAIVLVGVVFMSLVVAVPAAMSSNTFEAVDQQQLKNTTLNVFNALLLGQGNPPKWGSQYPFSEANVKAFGLSSPAPFSTYILDSDKVQRIENSSYGYISYARARELLHLQDYDFQFSLYRPFTVNTKIEWTNQSIQNVWASVNVTRTEDGAPIPNAVVTGYFIGSSANLLDPETPKVIVSNVSYTSTTNVLGMATLSGKLEIDPGYVLDYAVAVVHIVVAGMDTMVMASKDLRTMNCLKISSFGDEVVLTFNSAAYYENQTLPSGVRFVDSIYGYDLGSLMKFFTGGRGVSNLDNKGNYEIWAKQIDGISTVDPSMLIFIISVPIGHGQGGRQNVILAGPFGFNASNKLLQLGPENPSGKVLSTMRRLVLISGMTYVAEIILWKR